jgi:double-strand break repair protein MRE11
MDGPWEDSPGALLHTDDEMGDDDNASVQSKTPAARGRAKATGTTRQPVTTTKKPAAKRAPAAKPRGKKKVMEEEEDDIDEDIVMLGNDDDEDSGEDLFVKDRRALAKKPVAKAPARAKSPVKKTPAARPRAAASKQSTLNFSSQASSQRPAPRAAAPRTKKAQEIVSLQTCTGIWAVTNKIIQSEEEISDDDDAFDPAPVPRSTRRR